MLTLINWNFSLTPRFMYVWKKLKTNGSCLHSDGSRILASDAIALSNCSERVVLATGADEQSPSTKINYS